MREYNQTPDLLEVCAGNSLEVGDGSARPDRAEFTITKPAGQALQAQAGGLPPMPSSALEAALELAELSDRNGWGLALVPGFANDTTRTWAKADRSRADVLSHRGSWSRAVDVRDVSGQLLDLDVDDPSTEGLAAELAGDLPTFTYQSTKGPHRIYWRRDLVPADHRGNWVHDQKHPERSAEILAPKLDLICGSIRLWGPGKTWLTAPASIAEPPQALRDRIAACWAARQARQAQAKAQEQERQEAAERRRREREAAGLEEERGRWEKYTRITIDAILHAVACLTEGYRAKGLHGLAYRAGRLVGAIWSDLTEAEAEAGLLDAALACGLTEREAMGHIRRGLREGMKNPLPEPPDRALPSRGGAQTAVERVDLERQAEAAAASWRQLRGMVNPATGQAFAPVTVTNCRIMAAQLARRLLANGGRPVAVALLQLARDCGLGKDAIRSGRDALGLVGWTIAPGGFGEDGKAKATAWAFRQLPTATLNERDELPQAQATANDRPALSGRILTKSLPAGPVTLLERGLRRRILGLACPMDAKTREARERRQLREKTPDGRPKRVRPPTPLDALLGLGPSVYIMLPVVAGAAEGLRAAELAELAGVSSATAERCLRRLAEFDLATIETRPTAGRPAKVYTMTADARAAALGEAVADPSPILAATLQAGAERLRRAEAQLAAERSLLEDARRVAEVAGVPVAVAAQAMREEIQRNARAERDRSLVSLESPLIADARRRQGRAALYMGAALAAATRQATRWAMGAPLPQAVPA